MRSAFVVKEAVSSWMPNIIQRMPEQQNNPTMVPFFQEYNAPPNDTAITPEQRAPANNKDPSALMRRARAQKPVGEVGVLREGRMHKNTGNVTLKRIRLK